MPISSSSAGGTQTCMPGPVPPGCALCLVLARADEVLCQILAETMREYPSHTGTHRPVPCFPPSSSWCA